MLFPEEEVLVETINKLIKRTGTFVAEGLSSFSTVTADFIFKVFIFLFCLYYFLIHGRSYLNKFLYYLPLKDEEEAHLLSRFTTVTTATLKGTVVIGLIQGSMGGVTMALLGIPNTLFWGMIMVILSIIPAVGAAIVWLPAAIYLILKGSLIKGIIMIAVGAIVIGNIDNLLRPMMVGKSAKMPDLMILLSTIGGIAMFGISGIITGPIIAALLISIWSIYGTVFQDYLYPSTIGLDPIPESNSETEGEEDEE
jgi:predicted PurR-regulated permease PerM